MCHGLCRFLILGLLDADLILLLYDAFARVGFGMCLCFGGFLLPVGVLIDVYFRFLYWR